MSEAPPDRGADRHFAADVEPDPVPSPPRWVKAGAIVLAVLLVVMFVFLHLSGAVGPSAH